MKPGETTRADCNQCQTEFEVTLEPKAKTAEPGDLQAQKIWYCPFCGGTDVTSAEDE